MFFIIKSQQSYSAPSILTHMHISMYTCLCVHTLELEMTEANQHGCSITQAQISIGSEHLSPPPVVHSVYLFSLPLFQVVLPLIDQYFKNHRLYFLSAASRPLCTGGHASNKEKEMVTRYRAMAAKLSSSFLRVCV